jgi:hypothetical protein
MSPWQTWCLSTGTTFTTFQTDKVEVVILHCSTDFQKQSTKQIMAQQEHTTQSNH